MGFYREQIVPPLLDLVMRNAEAKRRRAVVVPRARGRVLEVGIGSGLNLPYYSRDVTALVGVEPSAKLVAMTRRKMGDLSFPVDLVQRSAEELPFDGGSFDTVVTTWVLCSIPEPLRALSEMRRVLAPGGQLLFVEHGLAPDAGVRAWQRRLNPVWRCISGGCNVDREIDDLFARAGFRIATLDRFYLKGARLLTATYEGTAVPA
ncbi:MAG TPA: methyltransferase domain-containing protein [Candidatus Binatia bacterium]|nr:methyltransferase domain-containing protein [Candidatus Binatia bacterium]